MKRCTYLCSLLVLSNRLETARKRLTDDLWTPGIPVLFHHTFKETRNLIWDSAGEAGEDVFETNTWTPDMRGAFDRAERAVELAEQETGIIRRERAALTTWN